MNFTDDPNFEPYTHSQMLPVVPEIGPSPNNPHWSAGVALMVWICSILFIIVAQLFVFGSYAAQMSAENLEPSALLETLKLDPTFIFLNVLAVFPAHILTLALAWVVITRFNMFSFTQMVGWKWGGFDFLQLGIVIGVFFALLLFANFLSPDEENELTRILKSSRKTVIAVSLLATLSAPIVEEVIYRGILYSALQKTLGTSYAIAVVTFLFALVHLPQYWPSYITISLLCLLSLTLTVIRARTGNLLPCIVTHAIINGIQSISMLSFPNQP